MEKGIEGIQNNEPPKENPKYDLPGEEYLNPGKIEPSPEKVHEEIEGIKANISYQNMMGDTFEREVLSKKMSDADVESLAALMVEEYDQSTNEMQELEATQTIETEEVENKQEIMKQKEGETSVFSRAVEALKDYLVKYPKVAKLAMIGVLASEVGGCATAPGVMYTGISGMQQSMYTQMQGQQRAQYTAMEGQQRSQYTAMQGQQQADYRYQKEMQMAEQERQRGYGQLDDYVMQLRSRGQENQAAGDISMKRSRIEDQYNRRVYNAQLNYQRTQEQTGTRQQQIQTQTQMREQQIQMQTQMRQQQIQLNTGARIVNQAIHGIFQGLRR